MFSAPVERSARFSHGGLLVFVVRRLGASAGRGSATLPLAILSYLSSSSFHSRIHRVYFSPIISRGSHLSPFLFCRLLSLSTCSTRELLSLSLILGPLRIERLRGMDCSGNAPLHHGRSSCFPWSKSYDYPRDRFFSVHYQFCILIVSSLSIPVYQLFVLLLSNFPFWLTLVSNNRVCTLILVHN